jgi:hypothetical protein
MLVFFLASLESAMFSLEATGYARIQANPVSLKPTLQTPKIKVSHRHSSVSVTSTDVCQLSLDASGHLHHAIVPNDLASVLHESRMMKSSNT